MLSEVRKVFQKKRWGNLRFPLTDTYHECPPYWKNSEQDGTRQETKKMFCLRLGPNLLAQAN